MNVDGLNDHQIGKIAQPPKGQFFYTRGDEPDDDPSANMLTYVVGSDLYEGRLFRPCVIRRIVITFFLDAITDENIQHAFDSMVPDLALHGGEAIRELERRLAVWIPCDPEQLRRRRKDAGITCEWMELDNE